jgi:hypothetical protein
MKKRNAVNGEHCLYARDEMTLINLQGNKGCLAQAALRWIWWFGTDILYTHLLFYAIIFDFFHRNLKHEKFTGWKKHLYQVA